MYDCICNVEVSYGFDNGEVSRNYLIMMSFSVSWIFFSSHSLDKFFITCHQLCRFCLHNCIFSSYTPFLLIVQFLASQFHWKRIVVWCSCTLHAVSNISSFTALEARLRCWSIISTTSPNWCSCECIMFLLSINFSFRLFLILYADFFLLKYGLLYYIHIVIAIYILIIPGNLCIQR